MPKHTYFLAPPKSHRALSLPKYPKSCHNSFDAPQICSKTWLKIFLSRLILTTMPFAVQDVGVGREGAGSHREPLQERLACLEPLHRLHLRAWKNKYLFGQKCGGSNYNRRHILVKFWAIKIDEIFILARKCIFGGAIFNRDPGMDPKTHPWNRSRFNVPFCGALLRISWWNDMHRKGNEPRWQMREKWSRITRSGSFGKGTSL